mmetsp:Transcript_35805/g.78144  ORF Transcript_35805/g.78144 Transcript_35805/m.78144 type:complete len:359 (+) Transcript_35805:577-1653(+)
MPQAAGVQGGVQGAGDLGALRALGPEQDVRHDLVGRQARGPRVPLLHGLHDLLHRLDRLGRGDLHRVRAHHGAAGLDAVVGVLQGVAPPRQRGLREADLPGGLRVGRGDGVVDGPLRDALDVLGDGPHLCHDPAVLEAHLRDAPEDRVHLVLQRLLRVDGAGLEGLHNHLRDGVEALDRGVGGHSAVLVAHPRAEHPNRGLDVLRVGVAAGLQRGADVNRDLLDRGQHRGQALGPLGLRRLGEVPLDQLPHGLAGVGAEAHRGPLRRLLLLRLRVRVVAVGAPQLAEVRLQLGRVVAPAVAHPPQAVHADEVELPRARPLEAGVDGAGVAPGAWAPGALAALLHKLLDEPVAQAKGHE